MAAQEQWPSKPADQSAPTGKRTWSELQRLFYNHNVEDYERERKYRFRAYARKTRILRRILEGRGSQEVLEVGAGSGLVTTLLEPTLAARRYVALDLSHAMLRAARSRGAGSQCQFVVSDACAAGLAGDRFDAIVGVDILHHLDNPVAALREWRRVARPGGHLVLLETNPYHPVNLAFIGVEHELRTFMNSQDNLLAWVREGEWKNGALRATPTFTPSGPRLLGPVLDAIDRVALWVPGSQWLAGLWLITAQK